MQNIHNMDWREGIVNIADKSVDLVLSDPPYGMSYQSNMRKNKHEKIKDDDNLDWLPHWLSEMKRVCKDNAHLYIFCSWHKVDVFKQEVEKHFRLKNILIWEKNNGGMGDLEGDYAPRYEMVLFCSNGERKLNGRRDDNILKSPKTQNEYHPTEKPVDLFSYLIEKSTEEGDLVLDTFGGSCVTAVACRQKKRRAEVFEIEEKYCHAGRVRLSGTSESLF